MFGAVQTGYDQAAIDAGLYRHSLVDETPPFSPHIRISFRIWVHVPRLHDLLLKGAAIPSRHLLVKHVAHLLTISTGSKPVMPADLRDRVAELVVHPPQMLGVEKQSVEAFLATRAPRSFRPYDYQLANVAWAANIERGIDEGTWGISGRPRQDRTVPIHMGYKNLGFSLERE